MAQLRDLKNEFNVIEEVNLYDIDNSEFIHSESPSGNLIFIDEMISGGAINSLEYVFMEVETGMYYILKGKKKYILALKIKSLAKFNKPILILKTKSLVHDLEQKVK